jgi:hypothetical protein
MFGWSEEEARRSIATQVKERKYWCYFCHVAKERVGTVPSDMIIRPEMKKIVVYKVLEPNPRQGDEMEENVYIQAFCEKCLERNDVKYVVEIVNQKQNAEMLNYYEWEVE